MYTVYVLHSHQHDKIYIGYTQDLEDRLKSRNELATKGWTINFRPWKLIHTETYQTKQQALKREKLLKGGQGRNWIRTSLLNQ